VSGTVATRVRSVCVFCGSRDGDRPGYAEAARVLGEGLAEGGVRLVYGGGSTGLMGQVAEGALAEAGEVVGVIPRRLVEREVMHTGVTDLRIVESMHDRKALMHDLSDAYIVLPGGMGTYEEFFEVLTWRQLGYHDKPIVVADIDGFFAPLRAMLDDAAKHQFVRESGLVEFVPDIDTALAYIGLR
jgi:uncharacterized protein (TIGR00730 family)